MKYLRSFLSLLLALAIICVSGCDISTIENAFGLSMNSSSKEASDTEKTSVEIEYFDNTESKDDSSSQDSTVSEEVSNVYEDEEKEVYEKDDEPIFDDANKIYSVTCADPDRITISFAGDVCLTEGCSVLNYIKRHDSNMANSFDEKLLNRMVGSDIFMLNNEFPYSTGGSPLEGKMYTFRAAPESAAYLKDIGTDIVSLANNHCYDYGPVALKDTFDTLRDISMPYVGAGENITEAVKPAYFKCNGKTIAFIAATQIEGYANPETKEATDTSPGVFRCLDTTRIKQVIKEADSKSDFVICFIHWGKEKNDLVMSWQQSEASDMASSGADLIIGAHSHCLQGIDYINGVPVFYSLGNYLFNSNTQDTCLVTATLDCSATDAVDIESLQFVPCIQSGGQTVEAPESEWARIIRYEQGISYYAAIDENGYVTYSQSSHNMQHGMNTSHMREPEENKSDE